MSENPTGGISKKMMTAISTGVAVLTYILCESGLFHAPPAS